MKKKYAGWIFEREGKFVLKVGDEEREFEDAQSAVDAADAHFGRRVALEVTMAALGWRICESS